MDCRPAHVRPESARRPQRCITAVCHPRLLLAILILALAVPSSVARACTTILAGRETTLDQSVIHAHNEDMGPDAAGRLWYRPATRPQGDTLSVPYVEIPTTEQTLAYWASGNAAPGSGLGTSSREQPYDDVLVGMNERGLTVSCNWMHSREPARKEQGIRRYAIRQLLLERATTAREAVDLVARLVDTHGQADWGGLAYCLADPTEAWIVETTTEHWVARRVEDDEILVVANRFTIGEDYDLASDDLISFARRKGWYRPARGDFSFREAYGRPERMAQPYDTAREDRARALLAPSRGLLTPDDLFAVLRDRYEGTARYTAPTLKPVERGSGVTRPIGTHNTTQSAIVAHLRGDRPPVVGSVLWYAAGSPRYSGFFPLYAGARRIPAAFDERAGEAAPRSAWWTFRTLERAGIAQGPETGAQVRNTFSTLRTRGGHARRVVEERSLARWKAGEQEQARALLTALTRQRAARTLHLARQLLQAHAISPGEADPPAPGTGSAPGAPRLTPGAWASRVPWR